jgi:hypothetical protein
LAVVCLLLAWKVAPFSTTFVAHGRGLVFWAALGLAVGALASARALPPLPPLTPGLLAPAAAAGFVVAAFAGKPLTFAVALLAVAVLVSRRVEQASLLLGLAAGAAVGGVLGRVIDLVLAGSCLAVLVLVSRKPAAAVTTAVLLAGTCALLWPAAPRAFAEDRQTVSVPASQGFRSTHITLAAGQVIHVEATGRVRFLKRDKAAVVDPNGYPARYSGCGGPGFCGVLVGRVGDAGAPFLLGASGVVAAPAAGELQLAINDYDATDNSGSFSVKVWTTPAGTAPTVRLRPAGVVLVPTGSENGFRTALLAALCALLGCLAGGYLAPRRAAEPIAG